MTRLSLVLALVSLLLAGVSLWIATDVSVANAAEVRRLEDERIDLARSMDSLEQRLAALARSGSAASTSGSSTEELRRPMSPDEPASASDHEQETASIPPSSSPSYSDGLVERFHGLTDEARKDALKELGERAVTGDERALQLVLDSLNDPSADVRKRAAKILGDLADPALLPNLQTAATDPDADVRGAAAESLVKLPQDKAGPVLLGMLHDSDPDVVEEAIKSLAKLDYREARPLLVSQLQSEDLDVAARAASALRGMGDEQSALTAIDRVQKAYTRGDTEARLEAVGHLRRIGGPEAVAELRRIMENDSALSVRDEARKALIKLKQ